MSGHVLDVARREYEQERSARAQRDTEPPRPRALIARIEIRQDCRCSRCRSKRHERLTPAVRGLTVLLDGYGVQASLSLDSSPGRAVLDIVVSDTPEGRALAYFATCWANGQDGVHASLLDAGGVQ